MLDCILVMTKKSSLMDIGQSVQISAGSWIVHMARTESQVERPKKNYRSRAFSNLGRLMQDPVIMRDRLVLTLSFFPTGGALPTTLVSVTSLEYLSLADYIILANKQSKRSMKIAIEKFKAFSSLQQPSLANSVSNLNLQNNIRNKNFLLNCQL